MAAIDNAMIPATVTRTRSVGEIIVAEGSWDNIGCCEVVCVGLGDGFCDDEGDGVGVGEGLGEGEGFGEELGKGVDDVFGLGEGYGKRMVLLEMS